MKRNVFGFLVDVRKLVLIAILIGLAVVIRSFATLTIGETIKVDFGAVPIIMVIGILFGPIAGALAGFSVDFIQFMITPQPGGYNLFIGIAFILYGAIPGILFFRKTDKLNIVTVAFTVLATYFIGFLTITAGMAWVGSTAETFLATFWAKLTFRLPSLLHAIWYVILTPTLAVTGEKILESWNLKE
jgi:ECF transporter S component (folate family)